MHFEWPGCGEGADLVRSGQQRLGFTEPALTGRQYSTGFPSGNLPPASFLPCDVTFLVICPTISTSADGDRQSHWLLKPAGAPQAEPRYGVALLVSRAPGWPQRLPRALLGAGSVEGGATVLSELTAQRRQQLVFKEIPSHSHHKTSHGELAPALLQTWEQKLAEVSG